ncbi:MAG: thioredoxin fold domain-containing protein [Acidobacteriota bacterium]
MRKRGFAHCLIILILFSQTAATFSDIEFIRDDLGFTLGKARKENKDIMIFFYTDWCAWCKAMDRHIFADKKVAEFLKNLVTIRINAEKGDGPTFVRRFKVDSYPTVVFLDSWGKEINRINGFLPPAYFLEVSQNIINNNRSHQSRTPRR